jgi:hypothetical protein
MKRGDEVQDVKRRGWAALIAGAFMVVLMAGVWLFILKLLADHRLDVSDPSFAAFLGKVFVAFALIILSGLIGIGSGLWQIRTGTQNRALTIGVLVPFLVAFGIVLLALSGQHR